MERVPLLALSGKCLRHPNILAAAILAFALYAGGILILQFYLQLLFAFVH